MKTTTKAIIIATAIASCFAGAAGNELINRPHIIANGAGHYNQLTGAFEWGAPERLASEAITSNADMSQALSNAIKRSK